MSMLVTHRLIGGLALVLLLSYWLQIATASSGLHHSGLEWVDDCRSKGFDPMQLACMTCDRLPTQYQEACRGCCQSYKDAIQPTKPYQAAVLLYTDSSRSDRASSIMYAGAQSTEVDQLIEQDWEELVEQKGSHRLQKMERPESKSNRGSFWLGRVMPAELLFLDQPLRQPWSYQKLIDSATEVVSLHGLSRDDMKDMIRTLLP